MAQAITTATATLSCGPPAGFRAAFSARVTDDTTVVNFTITAQSTGSPVVINQTAQGPVRVGGILDVMASGNVSLTSGVTYTLTGSATLHDINGNLNFNTIPIAFTNANNQITCGQQSFRDFDAKLETGLSKTTHTHSVNDDVTGMLNLDSREMPAYMFQTAAAGKSR